MPFRAAVSIGRRESLRKAVRGDASFSMRGMSIRRTTTVGRTVSISVLSGNSDYGGLVDALREKIMINSIF